MIEYSEIDTAFNNVDIFFQNYLPIYYDAKKLQYLLLNSLIFSWGLY